MTFIAASQWLMLVPKQGSSMTSLIDKTRIEEIGGLESPDIRRILNEFTIDLVGFMHLIEQEWKEEKVGELLATLHKLNGASRTCGFTGVGRAADLLIASSQPLDSKLHAELQAVIEKSIKEWQIMAS